MRRENRLRMRQKKRFIEKGFRLFCHIDPPHTMMTLVFFFWKKISPTYWRRHAYTYIAFFFFLICTYLSINGYNNIFKIGSFFFLRKTKKKKSNPISVPSLHYYIIIMCIL